MTDPALNADVLPPDVTWEILLRLPAKSICRFRAACRSWRSLLSGPTFIRACAARGPSLILALAADGKRIDMLDTSGGVVERVQLADAGPPLAGPLYLFESGNRVHVADPGTGAVSSLPASGDEPSWDTASYALGRVASTGQRKVLRVLTRHSDATSSELEQLCHVLTLGGGGGWRPRPAAPFCVVTSYLSTQRAVVHDVVVRGVAYFLPHEFNWDDPFDLRCVAAFDLESEDWRPAAIPGPPSINPDPDASSLKLAELNGSLLLLHHDLEPGTVDLWFMGDLDKGRSRWVKKHSVRQERLLPCFPEEGSSLIYIDTVKILMVLEDGRIVFSHRAWSGDPDWRTRVYDPRTQAYSEVRHPGVGHILGVYGRTSLDAVLQQ